MKSKKLLGLVMSVTFSLGMFGQSVYAMSSNNNSKPASVEGRYQAAPPNEERIIEALKKAGKLSDNATQEEIQKALQEYLSGEDSYKPSKEEMKKFEKNVEKMKEQGIKQEENNLVSKSKDMPEYVQEEQWESDTYVAKPLVILMDFKDYKYTDLSADETNFFFNSYNTDHYQQMLFNPESFKGPNGEDFVTMKKYYLEQSGNSYTVDGNVAGWYTASEDAAYYGAHEGTSKDKNARALIKEAMDKVAADPNVDLSQYDKEDRNDFDGDGNYYEPDGVIDHIIVVHAGVGEEAGGGDLGENAIWAHRYNLGGNYEVTDTQGRKFNANDYTVQPQDGAPGVFCHEYGHDLGLPDEYDTKYTGKGEPVSYWSIMSSGSWSGTIGGTEPTGFSPWCKQYLQSSMSDKKDANGQKRSYNWLKGTTVKADEITAEGQDFLLDQASSKGTNNDVVKVDLPAYRNKIVDMTEGTNAFYSKSGNNLDNSLQFDVDLTGKTEAKLKFKTWYQIEEGWDFGSIAVREKGAADWTVIQGNITTIEHDKDASVIVPHGITGDSKGWIDAEFNLANFAGKNMEIKFQYQTDVAAVEAGWFVDQVKVVSGADELVSFDAESDNAAVQLNGFERNDGYSAPINHYYLLEWRNHQGVDTGLSHLVGGQMSFEPGLVVWYCDNGYGDNWTGVHPGHGFVGVVDSDQNSNFWINGKGEKVVPSSRYQLNDAAFGLRKDGKMTINLPSEGLTMTDDNNFMHPYFDDSRDYSGGEGKLAHAGRIVPNYGVKVYVTGESKDRSVARIHISRDEANK